MRCAICGDDAAYMVNGVLGFCEDCFATIDDDLLDTIVVEELEDCEDGEELEDCEDDED